MEMMFGTREKFDYLECGACGTVQIAEIPDLSRYYPENYYSFEAGTNSGLRARLGRSLARAYVRARNDGALGRLASAVPFIAKKIGILDLELGVLDMGLGLASVLRLRLSPDCRILDVGCGDGKLLSVLAELGFKSLLGVDAFVDVDRTYPNGVCILKSDLEKVDGSFDLIMFHHSFEHLPDPAAALGSAREKLEKGGVCLVRIPVAAYAWEKYGTNWVGLDPPRHLHLFSEKSFCRLAEREGFEVESVVYDSTSFQFWGSEQYLLDVPLMDKRPAAAMFTRRQIRDWAKEARRLNLDGRGDQAAFYLKAK